ncbi:hypothetical protein BGZ72_007658 [Mortierella alpina]|nr:hypothetical protein BGZ72_007658 [Mortierella alpina]
MYVTGVVDTIPFTKRDGGVAIYEPEPVHGCGPYDPIRIMYPTSFQGNMRLCSLEDLVGCASRELGCYILSVAIALLYYGIKFSIILRTNTIITETKLGLSPAPFGINNFLSKSPARFMFVLQQAIIFGASCMAIAATLGLSSFIIFRGELLTTGLVTHLYALAFTCGVPAIFMSKLLLFHFQVIRNKRMQKLFKRLHRAAVDSENGGCKGTECVSDKYSIRNDSWVGQELPKLMAAGTEVKNVAPARVAIPWTSNLSASSSTGPPPMVATSAFCEYPQYFLSESVAALPASSYIPLVAIPEAHAQDSVNFSLSAPALRRFNGQTFQQRPETDTDYELELKAPASVVYGAPQKAFNTLGIFKL